MKKEHLQLESCTRTNSIVFGGYDGSSRLQTSEIISIDGAVEYGPELQEAAAATGDPMGPTISLHSLNSVTPVWRRHKFHLLLSPNMVL
jgi:hypothetical protein